MLTRILMLAAGLLASTPLFAGGDDYEGANDTMGAGPAYFGFVRDTRGSPLVDAQVTLQPAKGNAVLLKSNALGLYRGHINKDVLPKDVQISCAKAGYKQTTTTRRAPPGQVEREPLGPLRG